MRGRGHQAQGWNQAGIGQNAQGTGVLVRDEGSGADRAKKDRHHAVGASRGRSLAGTAVNVHTATVDRGSDRAQGPPSTSSPLDVGQGPPSPAASWVGPPNSGRATISMRSADPHQRQVTDSMVSLRISVSSTEGSPAMSRCQNSRTREDRTMSNRVRLPQCAQRRRLWASGRVTDTLEPYRSRRVLMSAP